MPLTFKNRILRLSFLTGLGLIFFLAVLNTGSSDFDLMRSLQILKGQHSGSTESLIFFEVRWPRAVAALLAGIALGVSGLLLQTLFRNPLAGPYVLGVSSGSGLGVALLLMGTGSLSLGGLWAGRVLDSGIGVLGAAFGGALGVLFIIVLLADRYRKPVYLLLFGLMIGYLCNALVSVLIAFNDADSIRSYMLWTLGSFSRLNSGELPWFFGVVALGLLPIPFCLKYLNAVLLGDSAAQALGMNTRWYRQIILVSASILAAAVTAWCGPIGFLGLAVPHVGRFFMKTADHRWVFLAVVVCGAVISLATALLAQGIIFGLMLPINAVTALIGVPIVFWVLQGSHRNRAL
jgi:iron complex transport system permease protein